MATEGLLFKVALELTGAMSKVTFNRCQKLHLRDCRKGEDLRKSIEWILPHDFGIQRPAESKWK